MLFFMSFIRFLKRKIEEGEIIRDGKRISFKCKIKRVWETGREIEIMSKEGREDLEAGVRISSIGHECVRKCNFECVPTEMYTGMCVCVHINRWPEREREICRPSYE